MPTRPARTYGYARVSSRDQNLARQFDALQAFGIEERLIYTDKASGSDFERPESYIPACARPIWSPGLRVSRPPPSSAWA